MDKRFVLAHGNGQMLAVLPFTDAEYERRLVGLRKSMREAGIDIFVSFTPENIYYVTGHDSPGYYFYQACVIGLEAEPVNILRGIEESNTLYNSWSRKTVGYGDRQDPVEATLWYLRELGLAGRTVGLEGESWFVSPARYRALSDGISRSGATFVDSQLIEPLRLIKSSEELAFIREAARISEQAMASAIEASAVGRTEDYVAAQTLHTLTMCGSEYSGMPPLLATGSRSALCHATWSGRTLRYGDVLVYELPAVRHRYASVLLRAGTVGRAPSDVRRLADACRGSLEDVIAAIKPGATSHEVHRASKGNFEKCGYGHLHAHRTGYSLGINYPPDWGEGQIMSLWEGDERQLQPGMVFHVIPGIYVPAEYLMIISETVLVTENGCEVLTEFPRDLFEVSGR